MVPTGPAAAAAAIPASTRRLRRLAAFGLAAAVAALLPASLASADGGGGGVDPTFVNASGIYIAGDPVELTQGGICTPNRLSCPQFPYVASSYGWQACADAPFATDSCGYLLDHDTSNRLLQAGLNGVIGVTGAAICGNPAGVLCGMVAAGVVDAVESWVGGVTIPDGTCFYLHLTDYGPNGLLPDLLQPRLSVTPDTVQVRLQDCPTG